MAMFLVFRNGVCVEATDNKGRAIAVAYRESGSVWRVKQICEPLPNLLPETSLNPVTKPITEKQTA